MWSDLVRLMCDYKGQLLKKTLLWLCCAVLSDEICMCAMYFLLKIVSETDTNCRNKMLLLNVMENVHKDGKTAESVTRGDGFDHPLK